MNAPGRRWTLLGAGLALLVGATAKAGPPPVAVQMRASSVAGSVEITLRNAGVEPLLGIQPRLEEAGRELHLDPRERLASGESVSWTHRPAPEARLLTLTLDYHDAAMFPYSAVDAIPLGPNAGEGGPLEAQLQADSASLLRLVLHNPSDVAIPARVQVLVPRELRAVEPPGALTLAGGESREISVAIENHAAPAGSRYRVLATVEYEHAGERHGAVAPGRIDLEASPRGDDGYRAQVVGIALFVASLLALTLFLELRGTAS